MKNKSTNPSPQKIKNLYLALTLLSTLATSFIWGIDTLFLLSAGLSITQVFIVNASFTVGQVLFEVPTGVIADVRGRRFSYLLGAVTLAVSTFGYLLAWYFQASLGWWMLSSAILGLGYTFFSGATEAWIVDALEFAGFKGEVDDVFARAQSVGGVAMLVGTVIGGVTAQQFSLAIPYMFRVFFLLATFVTALIWMKDWGFEPEKSVDVVADVKALFSTSITFGWSKPSVRWLMLSSPFTMSVGFFTFYAMQPYLLDLFGNPQAYAIAGLAAAIIGGAQIAGGMLVPWFRQRAEKRTSILLAGISLNAVVLVAVGWFANFWVVIGLLIVWGMIFAATRPVRQALMNSLIPSKKRATVLSFDALFGSSGGVVMQPMLGKSADLWSYSVSFMLGGVVLTLALPFILLARSENEPGDVLT